MVVWTGWRRDDFVRSMNAGNGTYLGQKDWGHVWASDGKVYLVDTNSVTHLGDYFEFAQEVREGRHPDYHPQLIEA